MRRVEVDREAGPLEPEPASAPSTSQTLIPAEKRVKISFRRMCWDLRNYFSVGDFAVVGVVAEHGGAVAVGHGAASAFAGIEAAGSAASEAASTFAAAAAVG